MPQFSAKHFSVSVELTRRVRGRTTADRTKCQAITRHGSHQRCTFLKRIITNANGFGTAFQTDYVFLEISAWEPEASIAFGLARGLYFKVTGAKRG